LFLDTRSKIIAPHEIEGRLQNRSSRWISGHFDPLLAEHVELLQRAREPGTALLVEVTNPDRPLLSQRARAELVAALSMVDFVVLQNGQPARAELADADLTERFVQHVLERHRGESQR
jgi:bifunctional ADP-heptose synthase (sugar kinase/adenylyltransferase)